MSLSFVRRGLQGVRVAGRAEDNKGRLPPAPRPAHSPGWPWPSLAIPLGQGREGQTADELRVPPGPALLPPARPMTGPRAVTLLRCCAPRAPLKAARAAWPRWTKTKTSGTAGPGGPGRASGRPKRGPTRPFGARSARPLSVAPPARRPRPFAHSSRVYRSPTLPQGQRYRNNSGGGAARRLGSGRPRGSSRLAAV